MRISIREQLALLVLLCSLMALMVLALATWFQSHTFITNVALSSLSLAASLKSSQLSATLLLYETQVRGVATRVLIQAALQRYNQGNDTNENWSRSQSDLAAALSNGNLLLQAIVFPGYGTTNQTALAGLVNITSPDVSIPLTPQTYPNGSSVFLGDPGQGFPPQLYPNLTYTNTSGPSQNASFKGEPLDPFGVLLIGPWVLNESFAMMSATTAIVNNTSPTDVLGWLTVVIDCSMIYDVRRSLEGLGMTGETLFVGPATPNNRFPGSVGDGAAPAGIDSVPIHFILPPSSNATLSSRHPDRIGLANFSTPFTPASFPAVQDAWTRNNSDVNNAGALVGSVNEQNQPVSVGYAQVASPLVDWVLLVEQSDAEVQGPVHHLRDVVLICVFCTAALLMVLVFPLAHYSIRPIRQLRAATQKTVEPYQPDDSSGFTGPSLRPSPDDDGGGDDQVDPAEARKEGFFGVVDKLKSRTTQRERTPSSTRRRRTFRIPSKVPETSHLIFDELTDLTSTFNEMSDELTMQYERLEERVKERTAELERSKQAAEAANQSKTLFIANISHELKTPLNGILGLTTVCMNEDDPARIRSTLNTIYKSGDLLLHLLTDILTFSKNEVGQQLSIDEAEFRLNDLSTQLLPTFEKQAREGQIDLKVLYYGSNDAFGNVDPDAADKSYGPKGTGRVRDMCLWGDKNRILQVLMNFVSNSLKFTPPHGSVTVRIRCVGLAETKERDPSVRKSSLRSQQSRQSRQSSRKRVRHSDSSTSVVEDSKPNSAINGDDRLHINVAGGTTQIAKVAERERSMSPPPINTKDLAFEFEVEDTGPGIPEDQQRKIFEPFVQGDLGLSKKYGGTGLGLSICAQLAALMGGDISLDSKVGVGSKFIMRLPLRYVSERPASLASSHRTMSKASSLVNGIDDSETTALHAAPSTQSEPTPVADIPRIVGFSQPYVAKEVAASTSARSVNVMKQAERQAKEEGRKVRVLVAEDNKINQEVVLRMLKLEDIYDVTIAKDGQEAFDQVKESMQSGKRFHLVFMDVQMPNVDGITSTRLIRGMGFSAPIVALTAFAEKSNEDECMASGMDYFLAKPIKRPQLKHVLKKYCATIVEDPEGEISPELLRLNVVNSAPLTSPTKDIHVHVRDDDVSPLSHAPDSDGLWPC